MRYIIPVFFLIACLGSSCVKKTPSDPIPEIELKEFKKVESATSDAGSFLIGYKDWDGDLFVNSNSDNANIYITPYLFNVDSNKFFKDSTFSYKITQPDGGYYKGKAIQGDILWPVTEFRSDATKNIIKFVIYMFDMKGNQSNIVTSPQYTLAK